MTICDQCRRDYVLRDGEEPTAYCDGCAHEIAEDSRAIRAIRAVVAAQWAVACALMSHRRSFALPDFPMFDPAQFRLIAALPTAEQIVDGTA